MSEKNRLSKILAAAGVASRREAEKLIFDGRVSVNGEVVLVPQTQVNFEDAIKLDGKKIEKAVEKHYFMLNKPAGYLCSNTRTSNRDKLVIDLFEEENLRLFTVGRLDKETEGLIIVTNDGHFTQKIIHPSFCVQKDYIAKTNKEITAKHLEALSRGCVVEGVYCKPVSVKKIRKGTVRIVVTEGKKHEVRLILEAAGLDCLHLKRIRIGHMTLGSLQIGEYRPLTPSEIDEVNA